MPVTNAAVTGTGAPGPESSRPLRADARRNRARVLEIAQEVFASEGLSVPIDEIARRAGVGVGTVYRHFPTKEALFEAVILRRLERLVEEARSLSDAGDAGEAFFTFLSRMVKEGMAKKDLLDALGGAGFDVRAATPIITQDLRRAIDRLLTRAQQAGAVRDDVRIADLMALFAGTSLAIRHYPGDPDLPGRMMAILSDGLRRGRA
jgi:AcrR family transcriptional regulator